MWKLKFWKLKIKFGNLNFEELFKDGILKINKEINKIIIIIIIIIIMKTINRKIGILEIEIKFGNQNFEELFKDGILKINK